MYVIIFISLSSFCLAEVWAQIKQYQWTAKTSQLSIKNVSNAFLISLLPLLLFFFLRFVSFHFFFLPLLLLLFNSFFVVVFVSSFFLSTILFSYLLLLLLLLLLLFLLLLLHLKCFIWPFVCFMGLVVTVTFFFPYLCHLHLLQLDGISFLTVVSKCPCGKFKYNN